MSRIVDELPLENGDHVEWPQFLRRAAHNEEKKVELIRGIVFVGAPVGVDHGDAHATLGGWLGVYTASTPGAKAALNTTLHLDARNGPEPDALLRLLPEAGGASRLDEDGFVAGSVELALEVAASSSSKDLHLKKDVYFKHGVREYLVYVVHTREVLWLSHEEKGYVALPADERGILRSRVFPGLWLDARAVASEDGAKVLEVLREGLATPEHASFVELLARRLAKALGT